MSDYQGLKPYRNGFSALLLQNVVSGCSALITPALARLSVPVPAAAAMHDWWIALTAALCGHIEFIDRPLVAYRQHKNNFFGAQAKPKLPLRNKAESLRSVEYDTTIQPVIGQARYLLRHSPAPLNVRQRLACYIVLALRYRSVVLRLGALRTLRLLAAVSP